MIAMQGHDVVKNSALEALAYEELGIETLQAEYVLVEASGGEKNFAQLFKLRSLGARLPRCSIYYIGSNVSTDIVRFAESIGVLAMHTSRLDEIETEMGIGKDDWKGSYSEEFDHLSKDYMSLLHEREFQRSLRIRQSLWLESRAFFKLKKAKATANWLSNRLDRVEDLPLRTALEFLIGEMLLLFALASVEAAGELFSLPEHQREPIFLEKLVAGQLSIEEKDSLLDQLYAFLVNYTEHLGRPMTLKRSDFQLEPLDAPMIFETTSRLIKRPSAARLVPQILNTLLCANLEGKLSEVADLLARRADDSEMQYALKFCRDLASVPFARVQPEFVRRLSA